MMLILELSRIYFMRDLPSVELLKNILTIPGVILNHVVI